MTIEITLTTSGTDTGTFNLYSDVDGYISIQETATRAELIIGKTVTMPDGTVYVKVQSTGACTNYVIIIVE